MEEIDENYINKLNTEVLELREKNAQVNTALSSAASMYQGQEDKNLIEFQLETAEMLSKIEHFLKGEYIKTDKDGNEYWAKQKDEELILFNDYGVNSIMLEVGNYIDKNTMLSFYDEMRINEIMADLGDILSEFIYCNYEKMGMNTDFKKSRFPLTVITVLHAIESAYRRAIRGKTSDDLNTSRIFTQSDLRGRPAISPLPVKKRFNLFRPSTW